MQTSGTQARMERIKEKIGTPASSIGLIESPIHIFHFALQRHMGALKLKNECIPVARINTDFYNLHCLTTAKSIPT